MTVPRRNEADRKEYHFILVSLCLICWFDWKGLRVLRDGKGEWLPDTERERTHAESKRRKKLKKNGC